MSVRSFVRGRAGVRTDWYLWVVLTTLWLTTGEPENLLCAKICCKGKMLYDLSF